MDIGSNDCTYLAVDKSKCLPDVWYTQSNPQLEFGLLQRAHPEWCVVELSKTPPTHKGWQGVSVTGTGKKPHPLKIETAIRLHFEALVLREAIDRDPVKSECASGELCKLCVASPEARTVAVAYRPGNLNLARELWKQASEETDYQIRRLYRSVSEGRYGVHFMLDKIPDD